MKYDNNSLGQAAFLSTLIGPGVDDSNRVGIWKTNQSGESELVARDGDEAINLEGYEYNRLRNLVLNESGDIAFSDRIGIWSDVDGNGPRLVVEKGFQAVAPGTDNSAYFKQGISPGIMLNSLGQLAFLAVLDGFNVDTSNNLGIWAQDTSGELQLVVRSGDKIDVDNSESVDLRTISSLSTGHMHETKPLVFNDHGQITFRAEFTDGSSGIFVSNLVAVPEPSSLFLVAIAMMGVLGTRSRRI